MDASALTSLALAAAGGFGLGLVFFGSLWLEVGWIVGGKAALVPLAGLARFAALALGLYALALHGAAALLAGAVACLAARPLVVRLMGKAA